MPNNAKINFVGNLTRDPVSRQAGTNTVTSMTVAVNTMRKDAAGNYRSNFYDVSVWGKPGEYLMQHLQKGSTVWVNGDFAQDEFTGNDGKVHYSLKVDNADVRGIARLKDASAPAAAPAPTDTDNEIPF